MRGVLQNDGVRFWQDCSNVGSRYCMYGTILGERFFRAKKSFFYKTNGGIDTSVTGLLN